MMRIAIAGGGYFGRLLADHISRTPHSLVVLSRVDRAEEFAELDCQVLLVKYSDLDSLHYALRGVDLVISTICGNEQLSLIEAARRVPVHRFVPSEFEGALRGRPPTGQDPLDFRYSGSAIDLLEHWSSWGSENDGGSVSGLGPEPSPRCGSTMQYTIFTCGVFYERFGPGGLGAYGMGSGMGITNQGDFLVDVGNGTADVVEKDSEGNPVMLCMTAMDDVAGFVAAAIEMAGVDGLRDWPVEYRLKGDQLSVAEILDICRELRGGSLEVLQRQYDELQDHLVHFSNVGNLADWNYTQRLLATANGRYSFLPNLNDMVDASDLASVSPIDFKTWLALQCQREGWICAGGTWAFE